MRGALILVKCDVKNTLYLLKPAFFNLLPTNDSQIKYHGEIATRVIIKKLHREFHWALLVADSDSSILGMYFLHHFNLVTDCGKKTKQFPHGSTSNLISKCYFLTSQY